MKKFFLALALLLSFWTRSQTTAFSETFESANSLTLVNGTQTNKWFYGTANQCNGVGSLYISNNSSSYAYTITSASTVHAYFDVAIPAGATNIQLNFNRKLNGEASFDYLQAWSCINTFTPTAGTLVTANANRVLLGTLQGVTTCATTTYNIASGVAGTTRRFIFTWRNDASGGTAPPALIDNITVTYTPVSTAPACAASPTAPTNGATNIATNQVLSWAAVSGATGYDVYFGTSATPPLVSSNQAGTSYTPTLSTGTLYYWQVIPRNSVGPATGCSIWSFTTLTPPSNDLCSGATSLPCATSNLAGTTVNSVSETPPGGVSTSSFGVWYTFTGDGQQSVISSTATFDHEMSILTGTACGSFAQVASVDNNLANAAESHTFTTVNGQTYYVWIAHYLAGNTSTGTFTISRTCSAPPTPPANDLCSSPTSLPCGTSSLAGTTVNATSKTAPGGGGLASNYGVWYTFTGDGQLTTISTTGTGGFDHEMTIVSGTCASNTLVVSLDNSGSNGTESHQFISTVGVTYYVYVAHYLSSSSTTGTFTISRTCVPVPANNNCSGATALTVLCPGITTATNGTTIGATEDAIAEPSCDAGDLRDVWFSFNTGNNTQVDITVTLGTASWIGGAVYSACGTVATGLNTACDFNLLSPSPTNITGLSMNTTYLLRIFTNATYDTPGTFTIRLNTVNNTVALTSSSSSQSLCKDAALSNITFSTTGATGATFSSLPSGVSGSWLNNAITISGTPTIAGTYNYTATLTGGCGSASTAGVITVNPPPSSVGAISGNTNVVPGTSEVYSVSAVPDATGYQWDYRESSTASWVLNISSTTSATVNWPSTTTDGEVRVTATNACGSNARTMSITPSTPLPVELLYFNGYPYPSFNVLKWSTASEHNSQYFELLHSIDGEDWRPIAVRSAAGNSTVVVNYSYIATFTDHTFNYYTLRQVDFDGAYKDYGPIGIDNRLSSKKVVAYLNLLGQEVPENTTGVIIKVFDDGSKQIVVQ